MKKIEFLKIAYLLIPLTALVFCILSLFNNEYYIYAFWFSVASFVTGGFMRYKKLLTNKSLWWLWGFTALIWYLQYLQLI